MNTKNKVNELLWQGLIEMMKEKDFCKITVKDLVEKSLVCRASFYKNFQNIEQVVDYGLNQIFHQFFVENQIQKNKIVDYIYHTCDSFYKNREIFELLYHQGMKNKIVEMFERGTLSSINQLNLELPKYHNHYFAGASTAILLAWLENSFQESPKEMTTIIVQALTTYPILSM